VLTGFCCDSAAFPVLATFVRLVVGGCLERLIGVTWTLVKRGVENVGDQSIDLLLRLQSRSIRSDVV